MKQTVMHILASSTTWLLLLKSGSCTEETQKCKQNYVQNIITK